MVEANIETHWSSIFLILIWFRSDSVYVFSACRHASFVHSDPPPDWRYEDRAWRWQSPFADSSAFASAASNSVTDPTSDRKPNETKLMSIHLRVELFKSHPIRTFWNLKFFTFGTHLFQISVDCNEISYPDTRCCPQRCSRPDARPEAHAECYAKWWWGPPVRDLCQSMWECVWMWVSQRPWEFLLPQLWLKSKRVRSYANSFAFFSNTCCAHIPLI